MEAARQWQQQKRLSQAACSRSAENSAMTPAQCDQVRLRRPAIRVFDKLRQNCLLRSQGRGSTDRWEGSNGVRFATEWLVRSPGRCSRQFAFATQQSEFRTSSRDDTVLVDR